VSVKPLNPAVGLRAVACSNCCLREGLIAFSLKTEERKKQKNFTKDSVITGVSSARLFLWYKSTLSRFTCFLKLWVKGTVNKELIRNCCLW